MQQPVGVLQVFRGVCAAGADSRQLRSKTSEYPRSMSAVIVSCITLHHGTLALQKLAYMPQWGHLVTLCDACINWALLDKWGILT